MLQPKLWGIIRDRKKDLSKETIITDIISGIIVAIIALPLSVALAIASGVTPEKGLVTAIIAGFIISSLGGSRVQIGGPTGAFVVIIYGIIQKYGMDGLFISTIIAGIFMIVFGLLRFGTIIKFIPYPTTQGFTTGIGVVLLSTQIKDFFGLTMQEVPSEFIPKLIAYAKHINTIHMPTLLVSIASLIIIIYWPKLNSKIPSSLIALVVITTITTIFHLPVETIGSRFGEISNKISLTDFSTLDLSFNKIQRLVSPAITIAFLASIESLLSAVVADGMIGKKHNANMELIAQGIANITSVCFGGIPATGAIARTAANIKNGGRTPIAGMVHALVLLLIMSLFMPLAKLIPMSLLAAILVMVAYNMSEFESFKSVLNTTKSDASVLLITFLLTIIFDLVIAIEIGMILAMFLFVKKMSEIPLLHPISNVFNEEGSDNEIDIASKIAVYDVHGPFFYGTVNNYLDVLSNVHEDVSVLILRLYEVFTIDASALKAIIQIQNRCIDKGIKVYYAELNEKSLKMLKKSRAMPLIGDACIYPSYHDALNNAKAYLNNKVPETN